jgi:hypothetical protein
LFPERPLLEERPRLDVVERLRLCAGLRDRELELAREPDREPELFAFDPPRFAVVLRRLFAEVDEPPRFDPLLERELRDLVCAICTALLRGLALPFIRGAALLSYPAESRTHRAPAEIRPVDRAT